MQDALIYISKNKKIRQREKDKIVIEKTYIPTGNQ